MLCEYEAVGAVRGYNKISRNLAHQPRSHISLGRPSIMLSLLTCALALLPSLLPSNLRHASVQPRRTTAPSMLRDVYDLVVVGGGPVGITAALRGAALGYDTILIDATPPRQFQFTGPTGLYSKALRDSAIRLDVPVLRAMGISDKAIWAQVNGFVQQILRKSGDNNMNALSLSRVPHLRGLGRMLPNPDSTARCAIEVSYPRGDSVTLRSDNVLLATGSKAVRLPALEEWYSTPLDGHIRVCDSDSIKKLDFLPRKVVVVGGGIIAVEFARIFAELNADVTMIVRASDLPKSLSRVGIDEQIGFLLQADLLASGVTLLFESEITGGEPRIQLPTRLRGGRETAGLLELNVVESGSKEPREPITADLVLTATGRRSVTDGLGLSEIGIEIKPNGENVATSALPILPIHGCYINTFRARMAGDVAISNCLETAAPGVYAAGDLIGAPQLASTGIEQAESAVDAMLGRRECVNPSRSADSTVVPPMRLLRWLLTRSLARSNSRPAAPSMKTTPSGRCR